MALGAYVGFDAVKPLITKERPEESYIGIGLAVASLVIMPLLAQAKRRVASALDSRAMMADSKLETGKFVCVAVRSRPDNEMLVKALSDFFEQSSQI